MPRCGNTVGLSGLTSPLPSWTAPARLNILPATETNYTRLPRTTPLLIKSAYISTKMAVGQPIPILTATILTSAAWAPMMTCYALP